MKTGARVGVDPISVVTPIGESLENDTRALKNTDGDNTGSHQRHASSRHSLSHTHHTRILLRNMWRVCSARGSRGQTNEIKLPTETIISPNRFKYDYGNMGAHAADNMNALKQSGLFIVFPPFRLVKTHGPAHKRPLPTSGDFSLQLRLRTPTHNGTNSRSFRSQRHMCNAALCTSPPPDVVRVRKPDT